MSTWSGTRRLRAVFLVFVLGVPIIGSLVRRQLSIGCAFDGAQIEPSLKVRVVDARGASFNFCCIQCAEWWLERHRGQRPDIFVTDEITLAEIPADSAIFVRSSVVTKATTGNRIHAFQRLADAKRHAEIARGKLLTETDRPFQFDEL